MKHDLLRSVAHNLADSLASGCGLMIGVYDMNVFGEAAQSASGFVEVDFLNGTAVGDPVSDPLAHAIRLYKKALPELCGRHQVSPSSFEVLTVRYHADRTGNHFLVTVKDSNGRSSVTEYGGTPGQRMKRLNEFGQLRPKPIRRI